MNRNLRRRLAATPLASWWHARKDLKSIQEWNALDDRRVAFYGNFIRAGDIAFDVGANIGNRTKIFRRLGATVIALEPQPYCQTILKRAYRNDSKVVMVSAAAGREEGRAEMKIGSGHVTSSLSAQWISAVSESGRFGDVTWDKTIACEMTTLDRLIATYGIPSFVKVDVEGYELQVLEGMSSPVGALSIEYTPECRANAFACIDRLDALGMVEFNYSIGEEMQFNGSWRARDQIKRSLETITDSRSFGDIYARTLQA